MSEPVNDIHVKPVVKVARDLTDIGDLAAALHSQAINEARAKVDGTALPGGLAMVALAPVANLEAWENQYETRERRHLPAEHIEDEDDTWEPPLATLRFWSDQWRRVHSAEWDHIPTIATEANFIRWALDWAWDNEPNWDAFTRDITKARVRLETMLHAGERSERGAPCMYDECRGIRLVRKLEPCRDANGGKSWRYTDWFCPRCHRQWDEDAYARNVTAAHENTKFEVIDGETWCSVDYAARQVTRPPATIRAWLSQGVLSTVCLVKGRRQRYVSLKEVREHHESKQRRKRAS